MPIRIEAYTLGGVLTGLLAWPGHLKDALETAPELDSGAVERIRSKAFVAPALIAVAARIDTAAKVPAWEQIASASCAGYAIALAAHQLGLGAMWKSAPVHEGAVPVGACRRHRAVSRT